MKKEFEPLLVLEILISEKQEVWRSLAYSHSVRKLQMISLASKWKLGTYDASNSKEVKLFTNDPSDEELEYPVYQIKEVPFLI